MTKTNPSIITFDKENNKNGSIIPIYNINDGFISPEQQPKQVYLTICDPLKTKGPHLHLKRWGLFTCIKGNIKIVTRENGISGECFYSEYFSGEDFHFRTIQVPAGIPAVLINEGDVPAYVLNMPSPAWSKEDPDDHPVNFDDYFEDE